jgi:hypothetical protein
VNAAARHALFAALGGGAVALLAWWVLRAGEAAPTAHRPDAVQRPVTFAPPAAVPARAIGSAPAGARPLARAWHDTLAESADLYAIYRRHLFASGPAERVAAWRAWSACAAFIVPGAARATPEAIAAGFGDGPAAAQRLEAWRSLQARCQGFVQMSDAEQAAEAATMRTMHNRGQARSRAEAARGLLELGDRDNALRQVTDAVASGDPLEIRELSGLAERFRRAGAEDASPPTDPVRDAALAVVACDLGLDCAAGSLLALRLCALQGHCQGDAVERTLADFGAIDAQAVAAERARLREQLLGGSFDARRYFDRR